MRFFEAILSLLNIAITICYLYLENHWSWYFVGDAVFFNFIASAVHLLAHESGHLIGGMISGYELLYLQLGPLNISNKNHKLTFKWKGSLNGQCVMIPKHTDFIHFKAYNLGGIFANALIVILSFSLLRFDKFWAFLLFIELSCIGIQKILVNTIPHKTDSIPNDGYIVKLLEKSITVQKDYAMYLKLYGKLFREEEVTIKDFTYEREISKDEDEMLYYHEIQDILSSLPPS